MRLITKLWATLLLLCVAGVANAAKTYEVDQKFTSVASLDGQLVCIVNETDAKAIYNKDNQNLAYDSYTNAVSGAAYLWKFHSLASESDENVQSCYTIEAVKADGSSITIWGNRTPLVLNSGAEGGFNGCFVLDNGENFGTDVKYGGVWEVEYDAEKGFAFKNKARGGYFAGVNPAPTATDPIYWTICTLKEGAEVPDPEPVVIPEPEAPLAEGELIPDFFSITNEGGLPYGYEVKFGSEDRAYPTTYTGGARMFAFAEGGDFTRGFYFREGYVQYGNVKKLALEAGKKYVVYFNSAMWKDSGATLEFTITKEGAEAAALTQTINNTPNVDGSKAAVTGSTRSEIEFTPEADGNYILKWNAEGWKEVLLANVGVKVAPATPEPVEPVVFDWVAGEQNYENAQDLDGIAIALDAKTTMTCAKGTGTNGPKYYTSGSAVRTYGGNTISFAGKGITKIVITGVSGKVAELTASTGELTTEGVVTTWKGEADEIVLTNSTKDQQHIAKLHVVYGGVEADVEPVHIANTAETAYDVAKAVELINAGEALDETVFVKGIISKIEKVNVDAEDATKSYITYWISADGTEEGQQFECYKGLTMEGVAFEAIEVGAEVIVSGQLTKYNDIYEFKAGNLLVSYKAPEKPVDPASITSIAKKAEMTGEVTSLEALQGAKFMLQNEAGLVLYTPDGWDVKVADLVTAASNKGNGGFFTLNALDGDHAGQYQVLIWNLDGTRRTYWAGEQYLNSQPEGGNVIFGLGGTEPNYGQDGQNLALWTITYEEGKGFAFHCVGRDVYLGNDAAAARPVADITYWKAYTGYIAGYDEDEILAAYSDVATVVKTTEDAAALADAKTAYDSDKDLDKFGDAVNAAVDIVKACVALNEAYGNLDATGAVVAAEVLAKYNAGEYANVAALRAAYILAAKAQTTAGANMTLAIVNPSFEDGTINGWVSDNCGGVANNYNFGARTGDKFCERWTAAPGKLSDGSFLQTITGIPNGKYILTAELQNREQGNSDAAGHGFFLVANDGKTEGVTNDGATIETVGVVTDGTLEIGVKLEGCTGNWICFDNFQLTYAGAVASEDELAALTAEIAIAKSLGVDVAAYEEGVFTAAEAAAAVEALKVAEYTQVNKDYTVNAAVLVPDFAQWTGDMVSNKGQHWDGTGTSLYYEQTSAQWGQSSWTNNKKTTVKLPKGKYVLYAAGRASAGTACTAYIKVNDVTRTYTSKGDVGFGVATDGSASFDPTASYANGGKGRGFEYRYVAFEVASEEGEEIALEIGGEATAEHQWMSFTAPVLLTTEDNIAIMLPVLNGKITAAKADLDAIKGTVGNGLFMKPQAAYDDYAAAVSAAEPLVEAGATPTAEAIKAAIDAIDAKAEAFAAAPVNAPDANKTYSFELRLGGETPLYMALAEGGITIAEEATLLKFIAVEGAEGQYNLSNADGTLFVGLAGGNAWTMSTLPDQKAAWTFTALPDGAYRINNLVTAGRFVGTNSGDKEAGKPCYADKKTDNGNVDWIITEVIPEVAHTWNFTKWSEATVANLKAEAAKVTVEDMGEGKTNLISDNGALWSDHEKATQTDPSKYNTTYAASKDNCFWYIGGEAEPKANGEAIAEFAGLEFNTTYGAARSLAIAVNYPSTSLGEYNGPAYLWFGGKNQTILTIKNVKAGSQIKMGVESHKPAEARGVQLLVGETVLTDPEGAEVAAPTVYTEQTWAVPAGEGVVDVVVKNTNGCHIYFIDAEIGEAPEPVNPEDPDLIEIEQEQQDQEGGVVTLATVEKDEKTGVTTYTTKDQVCVIFKMKNVDVKDCDYILFKFAEPIPAGLSYAFWTNNKNKGLDEGLTEFKYVFADDAESEIKDNVIPEISLLTIFGDAGKIVKVAGVYKHKVTSTGIETVKVAKKADVIYNLRGQKVNKAEKGLFIINGRKVVIK